MPALPLRQMSNQTRAFVYAGLTVLAWSTVSTAFKVSLSVLTPMQLIFVSMATAALFLAGTMAVTGRLSSLRSLPARHWGCGVLLGLMLCVYYTVLFVAYASLPAQIAQPVNYTWGLILSLLSCVFLRQRLTLREFFWMLVAYSGVVIITSGAGSTFGPLSATGLACVIASTVLYALYWLLNTKSPLEPLTGLTICFATACLAAGLVLTIQGELHLFSLKGLSGGIYVGLFELAIPFLCWGQALRLTTTVSRITTLPFLVPFLALFWVHLILHEPIVWTTVIGLAVIICGTIMQQRIAARKNAS